MTALRSKRIKFNHLRILLSLALKLQERLLKMELKIIEQGNCLQLI